MPNMGDLEARIYKLEKKMDKLTPDIWSEVTGESTARGINLIGLTTAQRVALGVTLATSGVQYNMLVYDTETQSFFTWSGTEWV